MSSGGMAKAKAPAGAKQTTPRGPADGSDAELDIRPFGKNSWPLVTAAASIQGDGLRLTGGALLDLPTQQHLFGTTCRRALWSPPETELQIKAR
jgi:hypothetical protein